MIKNKICSSCKKDKKIELFRYRNNNFISICLECERNHDLNRLENKRNNKSDYKKICENCNKYKGIENFKKTKYKEQNICRICNLNIRKIIIQENKELLKNNLKKCIECDDIKNINSFSFRKDTNNYREKCKDCCKKYHNLIYNKNDKIKENKNKYYIKNKLYIFNKSNKRSIERKKIDKKYHLSCILRSRLYNIINGNQKSGSAITDIGCSIEELKKYLENKFYNNKDTGEEMTWNNYGLYGWHIDHINPLSSFNLKNRDEFLKACHYTNLQPLWAKENLSKGAKI